MDGQATVVYGERANVCKGQTEITWLPCELFFSRWGHEKPIGMRNESEDCLVLSGVSQQIHQKFSSDCPMHASPQAELLWMILFWLPTYFSSHAGPERNLWGAPLGLSSREQRTEEWNPSCSSADTQPHSRWAKGKRLPATCLKSKPVAFLSFHWCTEQLSKFKDTESCFSSVGTGTCEVVWLGRQMLNRCVLFFILKKTTHILFMIIIQIDNKSSGQKLVVSSQ